MSSNPEKVKKVLNRKLNTLMVIEDILAKEMSSKRDNSWGVNAVKEIGLHLNTLKTLENEQNAIEWLKSPDGDKEILILIDKLQGLLIKIKQQLPLLSMKIMGGKEKIRGELKKVVNAKKISAYKIMAYK